MTRKGSLASTLELLGVMSGGKATITIRGHPVINVDADEKALEVDAVGAKEAGLRLPDLVREGGGLLSALTGSVRIAGILSEQGWELTLRSEGDDLLKMGKGAHRLTGRINASPMKARKLLKALR